MSLSHLAHVSPLGLGTGEVESLTSIVRRLAHSDARSVVDLLEEYVTEPYRRERGDRHPIVQVTRATEAMNGTSRAVRLVVERLGRAGIGELARTTFLDRANGIEMSDAFRHERAWCPRCLAEDGDRAYDRLVWTLSLTRGCSRHGGLLVDRCVSCRRTHRPWHRRANPYRCPHCGATLTDAPSEPCDDLAPNSAGALTRFLERGGLIEAPRVAGAFAALRERNGGLAQLSRALAHSVSGLSTVCTGRTRPRLGLFLRAVSFADEPIERFLSHASVPLARRPAPRASVRMRRPELARALRSALRANATPSLRDLTRRLHVDAATLRNSSPQLAAAVVAKHRATQRARRERSEAELADAIRAAFRHLSDGGAVPSRRDMEMSLGHPGVFRAPLARRIYAELLGFSAD